VDVDAERIQPERQDERGGAQPRGVVVRLEIEGDRTREWVDTDREGRRLIEAPGAADPQAQDVLAHDVDLEHLAVHGGS
jgi:hypothetical protein